MPYVSETRARDLLHAAEHGSLSGYTRQQVLKQAGQQARLARKAYEREIARLEARLAEAREAQGNVDKLAAQAAHMLEAVS